MDLLLPPGCKPFSEDDFVEDFRGGHILGFQNVPATVSNTDNTEEYRSTSGKVYFLPRTTWDYRSLTEVHKKKDESETCLHSVQLVATEGDLASLDERLSTWRKSNSTSPHKRASAFSNFRRSFNDARLDIRRAMLQAVAVKNSGLAVNPTNNTSLAASPTRRRITGGTPSSSSSSFLPDLLTVEAADTRGLMHLLQRLGEVAAAYHPASTAETQQQNHAVHAAGAAGAVRREHLVLPVVRGLRAMSQEIRTETALLTKVVQLVQRDMTSNSDHAVHAVVVNQGGDSGDRERGWGVVPLNQTGAVVLAWLLRLSDRELATTRSPGVAIQLAEGAVLAGADPRKNNSELAAWSQSAPMTATRLLVRVVGALRTMVQAVASARAGGAMTLLGGGGDNTLNLLLSSLNNSSSSSEGDAGADVVAALVRTVGRLILAKSQVLLATSSSTAIRVVGHVPSVVSEAGELRQLVGVAASMVALKDEEEEETGGEGGKFARGRESDGFLMSSEEETRQILKRAIDAALLGRRGEGVGGANETATMMARTVARKAVAEGGRFALVGHSAILQPPKMTATDTETANETPVVQSSLPPSSAAVASLANSLQFAASLRAKLSSCMSRLHSIESSVLSTRESRNVARLKRRVQHAAAVAERRQEDEAKVISAAWKAHWDRQARRRMDLDSLLAGREALRAAERAASVILNAQQDASRRKEADKELAIAASEVRRHEQEVALVDMRARRLFWRLQRLHLSAKRDALIKEQTASDRLMFEAYVTGDIQTTPYDQQQGVSNGGVVRRRRRGSLAQEVPFVRMVGAAAAKGERHNEDNDNQFAVLNKDNKKGNAMRRRWDDDRSEVGTRVGGGASSHVEFVDPSLTSSSSSSSSVTRSGTNKKRPASRGKRPSSALSVVGSTRDPLLLPAGLLMGGGIEGVIEEGDEEDDGTVYHTEVSYRDEGEEGEEDGGLSVVGEDQDGGDDDDEEGDKEDKEEVEGGEKVEDGGKEEAEESVSSSSSSSSSEDEVVDTKNKEKDNQPTSPTPQAANAKPSAAAAPNNPLPPPPILDFIVASGRSQVRCLAQLPAQAAEEVATAAWVVAVRLSVDLPSLLRTRVASLFFDDRSTTGMFAAAVQFRALVRKSLEIQLTTTSSSSVATLSRAELETLLGVAKRRAIAETPPSQLPSSVADQSENTYTSTTTVGVDLISLSPHASLIEVNDPKSIDPLSLLCVAPAASLAAAVSDKLPLLSTRLAALDNELNSLVLFLLSLRSGEVALHEWVRGRRYRQSKENTPKRRGATSTQQAIAARACWTALSTLKSVLSAIVGISLSSSLNLCLARLQAATSLRALESSLSDFTATLKRMSDPSDSWALSAAWGQLRLIAGDAEEFANHAETAAAVSSSKSLMSAESSLHAAVRIEERARAVSAELALAAQATTQEGELARACLLGMGM